MKKYILWAFMLPFMVVPLMAVDYDEESAGESTHEEMSEDDGAAHAEGDMGDHSDANSEEDMSDHSDANSEEDMQQNSSLKKWSQAGMSAGAVGAVGGAAKALLGKNRIAKNKAKLSKYKNQLRSYKGRLHNKYKDGGVVAVTGSLGKKAIRKAGQLNKFGAGKIAQMRQRMKNKKLKFGHASSKKLHATSKMKRKKSRNMK